mgnify:CR=1 FL=1
MNESELITVAIAVSNLAPEAALILVNSSSPAKFCKASGVLKSIITVNLLSLSFFSPTLVKSTFPLEIDLNS